MSAAPPLDRLDPSPASEAPRSRGVRLGALFAGSVLAAVVASVPAAFRMLGSNAVATVAALPWPWLTLVALGTPIALLSVGLCAQAREGLRLLAGERTRLALSGLLWWLVVELGILALVAAFLRKVTHHHALAVVTVAAFAIASGAALGLFAWRTTARVGRGGPALSKAAFALALMCLVLAIAIASVRLARAEAAAPLTRFFVDAFALGSGALLLSPRVLARARPLAIVGLPAALLVLIVGFTALRFDPELGREVSRVAPLHARVGQLLHLT